MNHRLIAPVLLATALAAQSFHHQPPGYGDVEGNSSSGIPFSYLSARVQQLDASRIGQALPTISALTWRRDRLVGTTATARTVDVTILMGKGDLGTFTATFANNWLAPPTTVYASRPTALPDITVRPTLPPAPFDVSIALDAPHAYDGVDSLLWEVLVDNGVTGTYSLDWVSAATNTAGGTTTALGTGCTTPNGTMSLTTSFSADVTDLRLTFSTLRAPATAPLTLLLGLADPDLPLPGLCANLRSDATLALPLGTSSATGTLSNVLFTLPWNGALAGLPLFSQVAAPDASQVGFPVALSNGRESPLPLTRGGPAPTDFRRTYNLTSSSAATGSAPSASAVTTQVTY